MENEEGSANVVKNKVLFRLGRCEYKWFLHSGPILPGIFSYEYFLNTFAPWINTWGLKPDPEPQKFENLIWIQAKTTDKTAYVSETLTAFR